MEDIILVTGCHRTRSWTNIAFNEVQSGAQLSLKVDVADALGANVNWGVSNVRIQGAVHNQGPSGENLPENQCMFVRGFRVKRILGIIPWIKAAAEPKPDPRGDERKPGKEVVPIPSATEYRDPLHVLIEYIADRAPHCDLVLVHDDDLERILRTGGMPLEALQPEGMVDYLRRSQLEIEVMSDPFTANDESPRTDTKNRMVARLSEELKSHPSSSDPTMKSPNIKFRVLIIGHANAGKTTILQRVCDTTDSPIVYRGNKEVRLEPSMDRGEHNIEDEVVFSNFDGYIFHESRGIEAGSAEGLRTVQEFIRQRSGKVQLQDILHAIWYCIPMDNQRPELDLKVCEDLCFNESASVPVIVIFTKYDQFLRNVQIYLEDFGSPDDNIFDVAERRFQEHYLYPLGDGVRFVRLEKMHQPGTRCDALLEQTAKALNDVVGPMALDLALDIQRDMKPGDKL
ncbi:hypothetical protein EDB85DRAFT_1957234 [Lactarius pseudohatsudake]|nr:hypothetical protein EDB85DRAFT_1957234 [Lactarius pseudohatsudake]